MKKVLLSIATLGLLFTANAQNLNYGFEETDVLPSRMDKYAADAPEEGVKVDGVIYYENWADFPNCSHNAAYTDDKFGGERSLFVATDDEISETWRRVIAMDNIGLKEKTSYRVSYRLKGKGKLGVALLKGCFNHDQALTSGTGTSYTDQVTSFDFDNSGWEFQSHMFWAPARETMASARKASWIGNSNDIDNDSIWQLDFLRFSFAGAGIYGIDDILVEESSIGGIAFNGKAIEVDFGYKTNLNDLTSKSSIVLSGEKFTVKVNGVEQENISVQALREEVEEDVFNTRLVIFVEEDIPNDATVTVSYVNDTKTIKYSTSLAPFSFEEPNAPVLDFENEPAHYDRNLEATSLADMGAVLEGVAPANREMHVDPAITEFSFRFSQPVVNDDPWFGKPVATLDEEELVFVGYGANDSILVFKRESSEALAKGQHFLAVSNVFNEYGIPCEDEEREPSFFEVGDATEEDLANENLNKVFLRYDENTVPGHNVLPTAVQGWRLWENGNWVAWGVGRNGTGGVMEVRTPFKRGLYLRLPNMQNFSWWYGCFDEEGAPAFELPAGKVSFSYEVIGWDGAQPNTEFHIYKYEEGKTNTDYQNGEDWYVKKVKCTDNVSGGKDGTPNVVKTTLDVEEAGRYVIRLCADGQAVFGNIDFEVVGSITVLNTKNLNVALAAAEEERANAEADNYVGATRDALDAEIKSAKETVFRTEAAYDEAIANLNAAVNAMKNRRANIDAYPTNLESLQNAIANTADKFKTIEAYANAVEKEAFYAALDYVKLDDAELAEAISGIGAAGQYLSNLTTISIPLLTRQMAQLAAEIVKMDSELANDDTVLAVNSQITDNQDIVALLKTLYTATVYKKIAAGTFEFSHKDVTYNYDEAGEVVVDSVVTTVADSTEMSFMIQNNEFYCTTVVPAGQDTKESSLEDFPGWNIELIAGQIRPVWSTNWGQAAPSATKPVENCAISSSWGTHEYDASQVVSGLPVGKYTASMVTAYDNQADTKSYVYVTVSEEKSDTVYNTTESPSRDNMIPQVITGITPVVEDGVASFTLGGHVSTVATFGKIDLAKVYMTGIDETFDYAKAAEALMAKYTTGIEVVERTDAPVAVSFFNLAGQQIATPAGVSLKVEKYSDGYTVVKKIMVK